MGMGASSTQGKGQGTVQPSRPTLTQPGQVSTLQPGSQIFGGTVTPNTIGPNGLPVGGTMPAGYTSPIPAQGGKFPSNPQQPTTSNIPGYAQPYVNALNLQQPGQVPAQGGKAPQTITSADQLRAAYANQPAPAMPRPAIRSADQLRAAYAPQPATPRPSSIGSGLAGLRAGLFRGNM